ncbi:hypothetical protein [Terriglobus sp. TAA 43]|uniref:hypothetical protein n=1 Tax=Terriglobus sp. TAA 43 TaxID=278961 RepID=UPI0006458E9E|nr:hypothetical protein [Terriglobus sp. TAA 43]
MAIVYEDMLKGAAPRPGTTSIRLDDDSAGYLMKAWLLVITNPALWRPVLNGPASDDDLNRFANGIGVDRIVVDKVLAMAQSSPGSYQDINQQWLELTRGSGYPDQACLSSVDQLLKAIRQ